MRPLRALAAAAAVCVVALPMPAADATAGMTSAYWWVAEPAGGGVPAPPQVPAGGLYVSSTAAGPSAISAVRVSLDPNAQNALLVLKIHQAQQADALAVAAYPATGHWKSGDAQAWSTRPSYAATAAPINGVVNAGATTVTFDLAAFGPGSTVDLVLVPGAAPAGTAPAAAPNPTFDVSFEPPTAADIHASTVPPAPASGPPPTPTTPLAQPTAPSRASAAGVLVPALPASSVQAAPPPVATPVVAQPVPETSPAAALRPVGRSSRDLVILAFLLADAMAFLAWRARPGARAGGGRPARTSIYDLSPAKPADTGTSA